METSHGSVPFPFGAMDFCEILVTFDRIVPPDSIPAVSCGAVVDFLGIVRPLENGRLIRGIDYEAHPYMAEPELRNVVRELALIHALRGCTLIHRIGFVATGEASLFLRVATPHRAEAYAASQAIVERLKQRVPIWKRPIFEENAP